jgi:probable rRNA maturation factor
MSVEITNRASGRKVDPALVVAAAEETFRLAGRGLDELSVVLLDDDGMAALNLRLLGRDGPTDVLAFEAESDPDGERAEIYLNLDAAERQAAEYGHSFADELSFLVSHGVLHALAYDDSDDAGRGAMFALQDDVLAALRGASL